MRVSRALKTYWDRQHQLEIRLEQEAETRRDVIKKAAKKEIELMLYELRLQKLYLIKNSQVGKNIDREI
jgi:hypothetical protein